MAGLIAPALLAAGLGLVGANSALNDTNDTEKKFTPDEFKKRQGKEDVSDTSLGDLLRTAKLRTWGSAIGVYRSKLIQSGKTGVALQQAVRKGLQALANDANPAAKNQIRDVLDLKASEFQNFFNALTVTESEFSPSTQQLAGNARIKGDKGVRSLLKKVVEKKGAGQNGYDYETPSVPEKKEEDESGWLGSLGSAIGTAGSAIAGGVSSAASAVADRVAADLAEAKRSKAEYIARKEQAGRPQTLEQEKAAEEKAGALIPDEGRGPENDQPIADYTIPIADPPATPAVISQTAVPTPQMNQTANYTYIRAPSTRYFYFEDGDVKVFSNDAALQALRQVLSPRRMAKLEARSAALPIEKSFDFYKDLVARDNPNVHKLSEKDFDLHKDALKKYAEEMLEENKILEAAGFKSKKEAHDFYDANLRIPFKLDTLGKPIPLEPSLFDKARQSFEGLFSGEESTPVITPENYKEYFDRKQNRQVDFVVSGAGPTAVTLPLGEFRKRFPDADPSAFRQGENSHTFSPIELLLRENNPEHGGVPWWEEPREPERQDMPGHLEGVYERNGPPLPPLVPQGRDFGALDPNRRPVFDPQRGLQGAAVDVGLWAARGVASFVGYQLFGSNPAAAALFNSVYSNLPNALEFIDQSRGYSEQIGAQIAQRAIQGLVATTQAPAAHATQILNPLESQTSEDRVSTQVQDVFARNTRGSNGVDQSREAFQNWFRDANSPFAVY